MPRKNRRSRNSTKRRTIRRDSRRSRNTRRSRNSRRSRNTRRSRTYKKNFKKLTKTKKRDERNRIIIVGGGEEEEEEVPLITDYAPGRPGTEIPIPDYIKQTLELGNEIIQKPELKANLLKKPHFRFLRDVVSATMKYAGIDEKELFTEFPKEELEELFTKEPGKHIDKKIKKKYLDIVINFIGYAVGYKIRVNPSKIIAGHEPEKTNFLLQSLFKAVKDENIDLSVAVARTKSGETPEGVRPRVKAAPGQESTYLSPNGGVKPESSEVSMSDIKAALKITQDKLKKEQEEQEKMIHEERELLEQILSNSEKCEMYLLEGLKGLEKP